MDFAAALATLWRRKLLVVVAAIVAVAAGLVAGYDVRLSPPTLEPRGTSYATTATTLLLDSRPSPLTEIDASFQGLSQRARVLSFALASERVRQDVARRLAVPTRAVALRTLAERRQPLAAERASQLTLATAPLVVNFEPNPGIPVISVNTQAPTVPLARRLSEAAFRAAQQELRRRTPRTTTRALVLQRVAPVAAQLRSPRSERMLAAGAGAVAFGASCILLLGLARVRDDLRAGTRARPGADPAEIA